MAQGTQNTPEISINPKFIAGAVALALVAGTIWTMIYTVETESQAVILRFGKHVNTVNPGLHFKLPFGIDRQLPVKVERQLSEEFGFGTRGATNRYQYSKRSTQEEKSMVTGDLNAALVEWVVQYRIDSPEQYLFAVHDPDETLRDASESVMREIVGDRTVDELITIGRREIEVEALQKLQELISSYGMGLKINQIQLKNVNPPQKVQASFNEVNQAQQEKERAINIANGEYNKVIPRARGRADQQISAAQGYAKKRVNEAKGDAAAFESVLVEYLKAPDITRKRIYLETLGKILPGVGKKVIIDEGVEGLLPLLDLGGNLQKERAN